MSKKPSKENKIQLATNKTARNKKAMHDAMINCLGVVTTACRVTGVSRTQFYQWLRDDPEYKKAIEDISEQAIDFVESKLFEKIKKGDTTAMLFYLKTKAKHRGYIEKVVVGVDQEVPLFPDVGQDQLENFVDIPHEEI